MKYILFCFCLLFAFEAKSELPNCSDKAVVRALSEAITETYGKQEQKNLNRYNVREIKLLHKNSQHLYPVDLSGFSQKNSPQAYGAVVETQINKQISKEEMRLCISPQVKKRLPIYVLIYPQEENFEAIIVNLDRFDKKILKKIQ